MSTKSIITAGLQMTRLASTEEFVAPDAAHWAIEPFIPVNTADLIDALLARSHVCSASGDAECDGQQMREVFSAFADLLHHRYRPLYSRFAQRYAALDPDRDTRPVQLPAASRLPVVGHGRRATNAGSIGHGGTDAGSISHGGTDAGSVGHGRADGAQLEAVAQITHSGRIVLSDAGYSEIGRTELEQAVGMVSQWGVPLHVDFKVFEAIVVYARGDVVGQRIARRWQNLYREALYDVALYQRVVVMFKLREGFRTEDDLDHTMLHLRMFKNIPKADIDMLLPGTRVKFTWLDHLRNLIPSIGGIGVTLFKIARIGLFVAAITLSIAAVLAGLCLALIGYAVRSVMNHFHIKNRYMLNLTRSLYYQKLDSNAGVAYRLLDEAESQRHREAVLAYYALVSAGAAISPRRLRRRAERLVRELVDVEIAFRAADAIALLEAWNLISRDADGKLQACSPQESLRRLDAYWDQSLKVGR